MQRNKLLTGLSAGLVAMAATAAHGAPVGIKALSAPSNFETARYRGHAPRFRQHHRFPPRAHYRYHRRGYHWGPAIGGLAAGALIGGAIASSHAHERADAYCFRRFRSYDPASGTYLGYDGYRHPCP